MRETETGIVNFTPAKPKRASELVFEQIESLILSGKLKADDRLPSERTLMQLYSRSHPTIREALRMLESAKYIRVIPGGRAVVLSCDETAIKEPLNELMQFNRISPEQLFEFMALCEPDFSALAAERRTDDDLAMLRHSLDAVAGQTPSAEYYQEISLLHTGILRAAHNPIAVTLWETVGDLLQGEGLTQLAAMLRPGADPIQTHTQLYAAIAAQDPAAAIACAQNCWKESLYEGR